MAAKELILPATTIVGITTRINLGSAEGTTVGVSVTGAGTTSGDADFTIIQSNNGADWVALTGPTGIDFANVANATQSDALVDGFTMKYI